MGRARHINLAGVVVDVRLGKTTSYERTQLMSRAKGGKLQRLTPEQRAAKRERNDRRKRTPTSVEWARTHIVKDKPRFVKPDQLRTKQQRAAAAAAEALKRLPAIDDAKAPRR